MALQTEPWTVTQYREKAEGSLKWVRKESSVIFWNKNLDTSFFLIFSAWFLKECTVACKIHKA